MTKQVNTWLHESLFLNEISPACTLCSEGAKLVLLITGICPASCFYCPLSFKKGGSDRIYANEWELNHEKDMETIIKEARLMDAKGAGITGGDPLSVPERTLDYIHQLKEFFSESFHIHLYTSGLVHHEYINDLSAAGLDEIRFHPMPHEWNTMKKSKVQSIIHQALNTDMDVAIEIPVIPSYEKDIISLIHWANDLQIQWINLNELEFSERNENALRTHGFTEKNDISAAVHQSQETAYNILKSFETSDIDIGIHYCSASFKDGIQLRNRMLRRANNIAGPLDIITDDATIIKGIIQAKHYDHLSMILNYLIQHYHLADQEYIIDKKNNQIQISIDLLEKIAKELQNKHAICYLSEQYPTHDQLEVERTPLPQNFTEK